jgi:hypothetical protein
VFPRTFLEEYFPQSYRVKKGRPITTIDRIMGGSDKSLTGIWIALAIALLYKSPDEAISEFEQWQPADVI